MTVDQKSVWHRVETTGYAAAPIDRRGWIQIAVFIAVLVVLAVVLLPGSLVLWVTLFFGLSAVSDWFRMPKAEGELAWCRSDR
ncbi:MAG: hypothetical protein JKY00_10570 [Roseicyclus sp.]|nr:hypothetical protein [Roseicyclus sp.]